MDLSSYSRSSLLSSQIFGLGIAAYRCRDCSYVAHTECQVKVPPTCTAKVTASAPKARKGFSSFMPRIASKKALGKHSEETETKSTTPTPASQLEFAAVEAPTINWNVRRPKVHPLAEHAMDYLGQEESRFHSSLFPHLHLQLISTHLSSASRSSSTRGYLSIVRCYKRGGEASSSFTSD
jgi:hypothetical protein